MNSVARINREHLQNNFRSICTVAGPGSTVLPVIKRNGYGHGAVEVARTLIDAGAQRFAVASTTEASVIRKAGITEELIVLCGLQPGEEAKGHCLKDVEQKLSARNLPSRERAPQHERGPTTGKMLWSQNAVQGARLVGYLYLGT